MASCVQELDLPFSIDASACVRAVVIATLAQQLAFGLGLTTEPLHSLRKQAESASDGASSASTSSLNARNLMHKRGLRFVRDWDALEAAIKAAVGAHFVHAALLVFGPNLLHPRYSVLVDFDGVGLEAAFVPHGVAAGAAASAAVAPAAAAHDVAGGATGAPARPSWYDAPFAQAGHAAAVARKTARLLIEAGEGLGLHSSRMAGSSRLHVLLLARADAAAGAGCDGTFLPVEAAELTLDGSSSSDSVVDPSRDEDDALLAGNCFDGEALRCAGDAGSPTSAGVPQCVPKHAFRLPLSLARAHGIALPSAPAVTLEGLHDLVPCVEAVDAGAAAVYDATVYVADADDGVCGSNPAGAGMECETDAAAMEGVSDDAHGGIADVVGAASPSMSRRKAAKAGAPRKRAAPPLVRIRVHGSESAAGDDGAVAVAATACAAALPDAMWYQCMPSPRVFHGSIAKPGTTRGAGSASAATSTR